ncbi:MAG: tetratricopeptide repeat protein [Planctomycetota bacterium]
MLVSGLAGCASSGAGAAGGSGPSARGGDGQARISGPRRKDAAVEAASRGDALRADGVPTAALEEFERAIELNPTLTVAYIGAAEIYQDQGDYVTAEQRYRTATQIEPANFEAQYGHGFVLQLLNRVDEAVLSYLRALSIREDDFNANLNLATAYLQLGEPQQARPFAERAVRADPASGAARANLGAVYAELGEHTSAVIEYQQAAERMELRPELLLNLADSLGRVQRWEEMASTLDQLLRIEPSAVAYERLGAAEFRLRRYDRALEAFRSGATVDPGHFPAWNGVGVCLLNRYLWSNRADRASLDGAIDALRRSLRIRPNQPKIVELVRRYG